MLFNSSQFFIFFPVVTCLYFFLPHRFRWSLLLLASCIFYMAFIPAYIAILFITILIDYFAAIFIEETAGKRRKKFLVLSIASTCLVLFIFKYFNFFNINFGLVASFLGLHYPVKALEIILPIGLSFHTFQSLSYVIEVYRGKQKAERRFGIYALYVMFYPQLVAGPIERPQNLLHQFYETHAFEYRRVTDGLKLMAWGLFKKVVIADRLSIFVDTVYGRPHDFLGPSFLLATVFFAFQIYCDFSGYSDIAIGSAQVMGFRLMENFRRPYFSKSIAEFWKRWHISLSSWFRDYVYIPLGGSRVSRLRWYCNIAVVFLLSGLWHGASWTYVIWGGLNGLYLIVPALCLNTRGKAANYRIPEAPGPVRNCLKVAGTFCLICFSWIFFRARDMADAWYIISRLGSGWSEFFSQMELISVGQPKYELLVAAAAVLCMESVHLIQRRCRIRQMIAASPLLVRWGMYYAFALWMIFFGIFNKSNFIYFQF